MREITIKGDLAVCWNLIEVKITSPAGGVIVKRAGNTLIVFRRGEDGQLRIWRDADTLASASPRRPLCCIPCISVAKYS